MILLYHYYFISLLLIIWTATCCNGGQTTGIFRGPLTWIYADHFCYSGKDSYFEAKVIYPTATKPILALYLLSSQSGSEFQNWKTLYNSDVSCTQKISESSYLFNLSDYATDTVTRDGVSYSIASLKKAVQTTRNRFVFFTFAGCAKYCEANAYCDFDLDISWEFLHTNGDSYFGANEKVRLPASIAFFTLYLMLCVYALYVRNVLSTLQKMHSTVSWLFYSIFFSMLEVLFMMIGAVTYNHNGANLGGYSMLQIICNTISECFLLLMILLIMKGWTIVRKSISTKGRIRLAIVLVFYITSRFACFLYFQFQVQKVDVVYLYETWPGYVVVAMNVFIALWVIRSYFIVVRDFKSKKRFYLKFTIFASVWALSLPLFVLINSSLPESSRYNFMMPIVICVGLLFRLIFITMYDPTARCCNKSFPFHATTSTMNDRTVVNQSSSKDTRMRQVAGLTRRIRQSTNQFALLVDDFSAFVESVDPLEDHENNDESLPGTS